MEEDTEWRERVYKPGALDVTHHRRKPSAAAQSQLLADQAGRCFWCDRPFGSIRYRRGKAIVLRLEWDHRTPFAYTGRSGDEEFVASCHACNGIKSARMFESVERCREVIRSELFRRGWR